MESSHPSMPGGSEQVFVASTARRFFAIVVDAALVLLVLSPLSFGGVQGFAPIISGGQPVLPWSGLVIPAVAAVGIYGIFLKRKGATPGKLLFGLKVVSSGEQLSLSWKQAYGRSLAAYLNSVLGVLPLTIAFFNQERRQLADFICGTRVIQVRPRGPVKIRWLIGGLLVLFGIRSIYVLPESVKSFTFSPEGIAFKEDRKR